MKLTVSRHHEGSMSTQQKKKGGEEVFERRLDCHVFRDGDSIRAESFFKDYYHDIALTLWVDKRTFRITKAQARMNKAPYEVCGEVETLVDLLCGLSIYHRAVNREVRRLIPRKEGCTHLFELIEFSLGCLFSGAPLAGARDENSPHPLKDTDPEEHRKIHSNNPWLKNTCRAFKNDND